jgi:hypothetical protein
MRFFFILMFFLLASCQRDAVNNVKDLDENMMDVRVYHENLGGSLRHGDRDEALWLLTGMDSLLNVVSEKFEKHRKLGKPFRHFYEKDLQPPIGVMRSALENGDMGTATSQYRLLTSRCNGCHEDHEVDKKILDWSR